MKTLCYLTLSCLPILAQASVVDRLAGSYEERSLVGIVTRGDLKFEDGGSTLDIKKSNDKQVKFSLSSVQSNGHSCDIEGVANSIDDTLVYSENIDGESCILKLKEDADALRIEDVGSNCRKSYCGSRAGLDIAFSYNSRIKNGKSTLTLAPKEGKELCFDRGYSSTHMQKNSKQLLSFLAVSLKNTGGSNVVVVRASDDKGIDDSTGRTYVGAGACTKLDANLGECNLDADAGNFVLQNNRDGSIFLKIKNGIAMAEEGKDLENMDPDDGRIDLNGKDKDNNIFKLYPTVCQAE